LERVSKRSAKSRYVNLQHVSASDANSSAETDGIGSEKMHVYVARTPE
jgi:hypothetical protein